jgi:hypothetical protein
MTPAVNIPWFRSVSVGKFFPDRVLTNRIVPHEAPPVIQNRSSVFVPPVAGPQGAGGYQLAGLTGIPLPSARGLSSTELSRLHFVILEQRRQDERSADIIASKGDVVLVG